ncbi:MAG TPA: ABC transporter permease [Gemmatimonadaceae bacterium]|jgi:predicted permease|nr:ABC transporter permease [Gemmatimonadaceae bacterium]
MKSVLYDVRVGVRVLRRNPTTTASVVATLALAIGAGVSTFALAQAALIAPPPFPESERLAMVFTTRVAPGRSPQRFRWSYQRFRLLERSLTTAAHVGSYGLASVNLSGRGPGGEPVAAEPVRAEPVGGGYFSALGARAERGRLFSAAEDQSPSAAPVVLLGHDLWMRRFAGAPDVLGQVLRVNGNDLTIVGVLPAGFRGLSGRAELWFPAVQAPSLTYPKYLTTNQDFISVVAKLRPGVSMTSLRAELETVGAAIQRQLPSESTTPDDRFGAAAVPLAEVRVNDTTRRALLVLLGAGGVVLLLACSNVSSLLIASAAARRREMAVRLALGATRGRLARQLLTETMVLASLGGAAGVLLAWWVTRVVPPPEGSIAPVNFYGNIGEFVRPRIDPVVLAVAAGVVILTTLVCGLAPALTAARAGLSTSMRQGGAATRSGHGRLSLRGIAVATEVALAVVLLVGGSLMLATLARLRGEPLGFDPTGVITFAVVPPEVRYPLHQAPAYIERLLASIEAVPGVVAATVDGCAPLGTSCARTSLHIAERPSPRPGEAPPIMRHYVGPDHFRTLGIPLRAGRAFTAGDRQGRAGVAIVNEAAARAFWPDGNPIGARLWFGSSIWSSPDSTVEVVGIVGDVPYLESDEPVVRPAVYTPYLQFTYPGRTVMVRTAGNPEVALRGIRRAVHAVDSDLALYNVGALTRQLGDVWQRQQFTTGVLAAFAALALVLAATGIFGVVAGAVADRTREIGIRLALGATPADVGRLVVRQGMVLPVVGLMVGAVLAFPAVRALRGLLYGVSATDPRVFGAVLLALGSVALLATLIPARRATRIDPRVSMSAD